MERCEKVTVLLFRAGTEPDDEDKYHKVLRSNGLQGKSLPVLSFEFQNLEKLQELLSCPSDHGGVILTSARAVEAMEMCITTMLSINGWTDNYQANWQELPTFVVGEATSKAANEKLGLQTIGHDSGSAEKVVPLICQVIAADSKPLLYPCGNMRRDTIPKEMGKAGISLNSIEVYKTCKHPNILDNLQKYLNEKGPPSVMVFFSPSGVDYALPAINELIQDLSKIKMVAIGNTTRQGMQQKGLVVSGTADKPTPELLAQCIVDCCS